MKSLELFKFASVLILLALLTSCSASQSTITPSTDEDPLGKALNNHYQFIVDQDLQTLELVDRNGQADVTDYFAIRLLSYEFDPAMNILYARVQLQNLVDMVFYGARLVFEQTGGSWLVNTDGLDWYKLGPEGPPTFKMPFIAFMRDTYHRYFTSLAMDTRELTFYIQPDVTQIDFWIDAVYPWEREKPVVEEQFCHKTLAISAWAVTAFCYDFQSHYDRSPRGVNDLSVWADLSGIGGPEKAEMFDDGMHWDYEAGDYIYGIDFIPDPFVNFAIIPIFCEDSHGNVSENQVAFIRNYTLRDYDIESIADGYWSELGGPHYEIIRDQIRWEAFWAEHTGTPETPPEVNFGSDMVLVAIAGPGGGGEFIEINHAFINTKNKLQIDVSIWNGSKGCILPTLMTNAYHIASIKKNYNYPDPKLREMVFYCDQQVPFTVIDSGDFSEIHDSRELLVKEWQAWEVLWDEHTGGSSQPPYIDFDENTVAAVFLGDRELDDTYVVFDRVMEYEASMREIYWSEHYPGHGCELAPLDCQPFEIIVFAKDEYAYYDFLDRMVPDDCV